MNREMELIRAVALRADALRGDAEQLGSQASADIAGEAGNRQIKNLENIASSALKVSDVLDYIKRQTAKSEPWRKREFGSTLLRMISEDLGRERDGIVQQLAATAPERQRIHLLLVREFVRQMAAHYAFARSARTNQL
jgi:hypothetical protein